MQAVGEITGGSLGSPLAERKSAMFFPIGRQFMSNEQRIFHSASRIVADAVSSQGRLPGGALRPAGPGPAGSATIGATLETRHLSRAVVGKTLVSDVSVQVQPGEV